MKNTKSHDEMTQRARLCDPTNEQRGWIRTTPSKRNLLVKNDNSAPFFRGATAKSTVALTKCVRIFPDGTRVEFKKSRKSGNVTIEEYVPSTPVKVRHRTLRADLSTYLDVADRVGLNAQNVATEYRYRRDNGYALPTEVAVETNATFRGGDR